MSFLTFHNIHPPSPPSSPFEPAFAAGIGGIADEEEEEEVMMLPAGSGSSESGSQDYYDQEDVDMERFAAPLPAEPYDPRVTPAQRAAALRGALDDLRSAPNIVMIDFYFNWFSSKNTNFRSLRQVQMNLRTITVRVRPPATAAGAPDVLCSCGEDMDPYHTDERGRRRVRRCAHAASLDELLAGRSLLRDGEGEGEGASTSARPRAAGAGALVDEATGLRFLVAGNWHNAFQAALQLSLVGRDAAPAVKAAALGWGRSGFGGGVFGGEEPTVVKMETLPASNFFFDTSQTRGTYFALGSLGVRAGVDLAPPWDTDPAELDMNPARVRYEYVPHFFAHVRAHCTCDQFDRLRHAHAERDGHSTRRCRHTVAVDDALAGPPLQPQPPQPHREKPNAGAASSAYAEQQLHYFTPANWRAAWTFLSVVLCRRPDVIADKWRGVRLDLIS